jgi:hypothetical protein
MIPAARWATKVGWVVVLVVALGVPWPARAARLCGFAYNFGNGAQAKVRLKAYRVGEGGVDARLVCTKWRTICNGRAGSIHAVVGTVPGTSAAILQGTLRYGTRLTCGVYCQVEGTVEAPGMLFCQFNCPAGSAAEQVSFTVGPTVCR